MYYSEFDTVAVPAKPSFCPYFSNFRNIDIDRPSEAGGQARRHGDHRQECIDSDPASRVQRARRNVEHRYRNVDNNDRTVRQTDRQTDHGDAPRQSDGPVKRRAEKHLIP